MHRRWLLKRTNPEYLDYLCRAASVPPALAQVLVNRGVKTPAEIAAFMSPALESLGDPFDIGGVDDLVETVLGARKRGTRVFVHGDYDADGLTATAIMVGALRILGIETDYYIPNRFSDGYGFHPRAVERAASLGAGLIITVDCGITSFEAAGEARKRGIGLVITDHHEPGAELPEALAVINPKLQAPASPAAGLSGAGIALRAVEALARGAEGLEPLEFMDLAALGTLADSVPLVGENRVIVKEGLALISDPRRAGLRALRDVSGVGKRELRAGLLAFTLIPRINAAGRLADATEVVDLMLTDSSKRAEEIALSLDRMNTERQKTEEAVLGEALEMIERRGHGSAIVLAAEGWHEGVLGIVASKIAETYNRPSFVLSIKDGAARGSARSAGGFDVHAALAKLRKRLLRFGGHKQAAGLKLDLAELPAFEREMDSLAGERLEDFRPVLDIDAEVDLRDVTFSLVRELERLEPFGAGNPSPVLGARGLDPINPRVVGNNHLKVKLRGGNCAHDAIGWGMGELLGFVSDSGAVDAAFAATINDWDKGRMVQLSLKGLRTSGGEAA
ncbi:MAG: single-stranded-DNA-specific exonuclease RecJ [Nitrospirota bacterium]|jgi:single-stranded-DNA-specific exonuclease